VTRAQRAAKRKRWPALHPLLWCTGEQRFRAWYAEGTRVRCAGCQRVLIQEEWTVEK